MDHGALKNEKAKFLTSLKYLPQTLYGEIERLLTAPISESHLPDPETGLLFESMVTNLPQDFDYAQYPNVNRLIGHLILRSELKTDRLMEEVKVLADRISEVLAGTEQEKKIVSLFEDYRLLQRLFSLEVTPEDYEDITKRSNALSPKAVSKRFLDVNRDQRVLCVIHRSDNLMGSGYGNDICRRQEPTDCSMAKRGRRNQHKYADQKLPDGNY